MATPMENEPVEGAGPQGNQTEVEVVFSSQWRLLLGVSGVREQLGGAATFGDLLAALASRFSPHFGEQALDAEGRLRASILVCYDDQQVIPDARDPLPRGIVVTLMSPISGG